MLITALVGLAAGGSAAPPLADSPATDRAPTAPTNNVALIKIEGLIYDYVLQNLQQQAQRATDDGATLIVLEINTPGGLVHSALKISKAIKSLPVPTVAWVNNEALSAGALIAAACNRIVMAPSSMIGDCAPIVPGMNLAPTERAKALSPILEEFRDSATANDYDFALFHAMCTLGVEVYQVRDPHTGRTRLVNQADYRIMVQANPPPEPSPAAPVPDPDAHPTAEIHTDLADASNRGRWELVKQVHDGTTLLTLSQRRAHDIGLCQADIPDTDQLTRYLQAASTKRYTPSRVALLAYWLTQPWVRALLIVAAMSAAYVELQAPGLGLPGLTAVVILAVLLVAPFLVGMAQVWHILLFGLGVVMLLVEVMVLPGFGVMGALGLMGMFVGLILMVVPTVGDGPLPLPPPEMSRRLQQSVLAGLSALIATGVVFYYLTKHFGHIPGVNRLILHSPPLVTDTYPTDSPNSPRPPTGSPTRDTPPDNQTLQPGMIGRAVTGLRPTGRALIADQTVDVVTAGEWIDSGRPLRVVEVHGNRIVVELTKHPT